MRTPARSLLALVVALAASSPLARASSISSATGGCGAGSGSTIDPTCSGTITYSGGSWSGSAQVSITSPFPLSPGDPTFVVDEVGAPDVNVDQFLFSFNTGTGTFSFNDITNDAYSLTGDVVGFTPGTDSLTLTLMATQQIYYIAGSLCTVSDLNPCVLNANGIALISPLSDEPLGTGTINYVGDPTVTGVTFDLPTSVTPEPSSLLLLGTGLVGLHLMPSLRKRCGQPG